MNREIWNDKIVSPIGKVVSIAHPVGHKFV